MKTNYTLFHPYYLLKQNYTAIFYRSHISFFLELLKFIIKKKTFFMINNTIFYKFIISYFNNYNKEQFYKKDSYLFFLDIIINIKCIYTQKNYNLYTYLVSLIGVVLYFSCYNITVCSIPCYEKTEQNNILLLIEELIQKYKYNPKIIFITPNQEIQKGIILQYKGFMVDLSLKKLYELLNNQITINNIGEL